MQCVWFSLTKDKPPGNWLDWSSIHEQLSRNSLEQHSFTKSTLRCQVSQLPMLGEHLFQQFSLAYSLVQKVLLRVPKVPHLHQPISLVKGWIRGGVGSYRLTGFLCQVSYLSNVE